MRHWRLRSAITLALLGGMVGAACGPSDVTDTTSTTAASTTSVATTTSSTAPPTTTSTEPRSKFGGTVVIGYDQPPPTLNPYIAGGDNTVVTLIGQAIQARGWDIDADTRAVLPDVLAEIPTVASGNLVVNPNRTMTVTYRVRDEARWSDGVPITGDDLAFTIDVVKAQLAAGLTSIDPEYGQISGYEVTGNAIAVTVRHATLAYETFFEWIVPKHAVEGTDFATDWQTAIWPGAGPFIVDSWDAPNGDLTLVRNPNYWKTDPDEGRALPYLDEVVFRVIPDTQQLLTAFTDGELDVISPPPESDTISLLEAADPSVFVDVLPGSIWEHLSFQFGPGRLDRNADSINDNLAYRRAVAHLIDRFGLRDQVPWWLPISSFLDVAVPSLSSHAWDRYPYDVETARALVDLAKSETGIDTIHAVFSATSNSGERPAVAAGLAPMFEAAGIDYETQLEDSSLFFGQTLSDGVYDLGMWGWVGQPTHADLVATLALFDPNAPPPGGSNYYRWGTRDSSVRDEHTEAFAELLAEANSTVDVDEIDGLVVQAEQLLADQVVIIPLFARPDALAWWGDHVTGILHNPTEAGFTWDIEDWYRTPG